MERNSCHASDPDRSEPWSTRRHSWRTSRPVAARAGARPSWQPRPRRTRAPEGRHPRDRRHDRRRPAQGRASQATRPGALSIESLIKGAPGIEKLARSRRRADRQHRQPGHERRGVGEAREARERAARHAATSTASSSPTAPTRWRRRHSSSASCCGATSRSCSSARCGRRRPPAPMVRSTSTTRSPWPADPRRAGARRAGRRKRRHPLGTRHPQDAHHRGPDVRVVQPRPGRARVLRQAALLQHADLPPHDEERVSGAGHDVVSAGGHRLSRTRAWTARW